ncbi:hypothetical protein Thal_0383 [Thermocrinis albus DSM 14484]|uniref:Uncharacterized protein n=1 Tax=Thermocrinis albus (strain DSM 14484 / JCM 11386 / HI 11/12) TaxID=638303 RepID=D3SPD1_THEAH|nr:hypothetical protein [Thermocrinis albus]ADC89018.1 hypothetical protein Thal_0383 [Thermocrinis albus DSM 14484]
MRKLEVNKDKSLAFLLGIIYGYRTAHIGLEIKDLTEFDKKNHINDRVYYLNRKSNTVSSEELEEPTHICAIREEKQSGKVLIFIYKRR